MTNMAGQDASTTKGKLLVVGFGPGNFEHITDRARQAIQESDVIIGYNTYVDLIRGLLTDQEIVRTGMTEEVSRAIEAVKQAEMGKKVAVISSGDAGVYGMAGLVYEVLIQKGWTEGNGVDIEVIPGVSAVNSSASLLGAPLMHDFCTISLSDHLTPWEVIAKRVEGAGMADFVIALYNPRSGRRTRQIVETQQILLQYRSPQTPVGLVKSAYRERQSVILTTLGEMLEHDIGMLTTVIIGNSSTFVYDGKMITPRGYQRKYTLDRQEQSLRMNERLQEKHEPWALHGGVSDRVRTVEESTVAVEELPVTPVSALETAMHAVALLAEKGLVTAEVSSTYQIPAFDAIPAILEIAVSPGVANKKITTAQMAAIIDTVGEDGEIEYTPNHYILLRIPTHNPDAVTSQLESVGLMVQPIGDVLQVKACDFCNGDKGQAIPQAQEMADRFAGMHVPKELKIGVAGCSMACYGSVNEDIAVVYRRGSYDLFLGGKAIGRNAHPAQRVAEGIAADELVDTIGRILTEYKEKGYADERFHKFFKRLGVVAGFEHEDYVSPLQIESVCGE